jgi:hypothetical protein
MSGPRASGLALVCALVTAIQADSTWRSSTHLGTEYAALLVDAEYRHMALDAPMRAIDRLRRAV